MLDSCGMRGLVHKAVISTGLCLIAAFGESALAADPDPIYLGVAVPKSGWGALRVVFRYHNGQGEPMPETPIASTKWGSIWE
jgi:hypothetical protein